MVEFIMKGKVIMEIERKFLLSKLPSMADIPLVEHHVTDRVYLSVTHKADGKEIEQEVRVTHWVNDPERFDRITFKSGGNLCREEYEANVKPSFYALVASHYIRKSIYPIRKDLYTDPATGVDFSVVDHGAFIYAEKEFESEVEARDWKWPYPDVEVTEITDDPEYKMANYWCKSRGISY